MEQFLEERIRRRAYDLWEKEGRPDGRDREHWLQAEAEVDEAPKVATNAGTSSRTPITRTSRRTGARPRNAERRNGQPDGSASSA